MLSPMYFRSVTIISAAALAIVPVVSQNPSVWLLISLGALILFSEGKAIRAENSRASKIQDILHRALRVVTDLASIVGGKADLWVVDIYLPEWKWSTFKGPRRQLVRKLSISLTDVQSVPSAVAIAETSPLVQTYKSTKRVLWCDNNLCEANLEEDSHWGGEYDDQLRGTYGAISINPLVSNTGHDCRGILVVHTKPEQIAATTAVGALNSSPGRRNIAEACHDIHGILL